mgnify:CR=1 FL=1
MVKKMIAGSNNNGLNFRMALTFFAGVITLTNNVVFTYAANDSSSDASMDLLTDAISARFSNFTDSFKGDITKEMGFCIDNV